MDKKKAASYAIGILISGAALYFAFRNVPFASLYEYLKSVRYGWLIPAAAINYLAFLIRVKRWQIILGAKKTVSFAAAYHPLMIGFMLNCIVPGRAGELVRPGILAKRENLSYTMSLATVAAERVFDVMVLLGMFLVVMAYAPIDTDKTMTFGNLVLGRDTLFMVRDNMVKLFAVLLAGMVMVSLENVRNLLKKIIIGIPPKLFFFPKTFRDTLLEKICVPVTVIMDNIASGFALLKDPVRLLSCIVLSVGVWVVSAWSYHATVPAFPGLVLSFQQTAAVLVIIGFFVALPSVPGFWGLWEAGGVFALSLYGVDPKLAAGFALINHVTQMFPVMLAGGISALITGFRLKQQQSAVQAEPAAKT